MVPLRYALALLALPCLAGTAYAGLAATPIPEPASLGLLAAGVADLAVARALRRRK